MPVNWSNNHFLRAFELDEIFLPLFFHVSLLTAIRLIRLVCVEWSDREQYLLCMLRHTLVDAILCLSLYPACASVVHVAMPASHAKAIFVVCKTNKYVDRLEQNEQRSGKSTYWSEIWRMDLLLSHSQEWLIFVLAPNNWVYESFTLRRGSTTCCFKNKQVPVYLYTKKNKRLWHLLRFVFPCLFVDVNFIKLTLHWWGMFTKKTF